MKMDSQMIGLLRADIVTVIFVKDAIILFVNIVNLMVLKKLKIFLV